MEFKKEVLYNFKYRDDVEKVLIVTDSIEGRRYVTNEKSDITKLQHYYMKGLNYVGTKSDYQEFEPILVNEKIFSDTNQNTYIELFYKLPDVDAYAKALYSGYQDPGDASLVKTFEVTLLDKAI